MRALLRIAYPLLASIYLISARWIPYPGHPLVKAVPILLLAAVVLAGARRSASRLVFGVGLLFSAGGDIVLASAMPRAFVIGLSFFFAAHVFYAVSLYRRRKVRLSARRLPLGLVLAIVLVMSSLVLPRAGALLVPVAVYMLAIAVMAILAAVQRDEALSLYGGAVSFVVSDSIIALDKFVAQVPLAGMLVMCTYYLAQFLLARGILGRARP